MEGKMCLILVSYDQHPDYLLIFAANRDEFYNRPTLPLAFWEDKPAIIAGRDMKSRGTWLGVRRSGRFAAVTNYRDPSHYLPHAPSRGALVSDFLTSSESARTYLKKIATVGQDYNGFNLLIGDRSGLWYYSNRGNDIQKLEPGLLGISNHLIETPWPKVKKGKARLQDLVLTPEDIDPEDLFHILADRSVPPDDSLPQTGVGIEWERILSPLFITSKDYGTRSSSVLLIKRNGRVTFVERSFKPEANGTNPHETRKFSFTISRHA
jgi:uncharacterized protein with NRDE domain